MKTGLTRLAVYPKETGLRLPRLRWQRGNLDTPEICCRFLPTSMICYRGQIGLPPDEVEFFYLFAIAEQFAGQELVFLKPLRAAGKPAERNRVAANTGADQTDFLDADAYWALCRVMRNNRRYDAYFQFGYAFQERRFEFRMPQRRYYRAGKQCRPIRGNRHGTIRGFFGYELQIEEIRKAGPIFSPACSEL